MEYRVLTGEQFDEAFLEQVMDVDRECYASEYVGELANMVARYRKNRKSFVCVMNGEELAGYINFFPTTDALWNDITRNSMVIRDDDIRPEEVADYQEKGNRLYILSVAIREKYRHQKAVVKCLTDSFIDYLNTINKAYEIEAIAAVAVSKDGRKFLSNCMFGEVRKLDDGNVVYVCDGPYLKKLLENDLYFKSYENDVYLFLPFVDNEKNKRMDNLQDLEERPPLVSTMMDALDDCLKYEYSSDVVTELERVYLGSYELMHTLDIYPESDDMLPHIVGEETVYISLLMHRRSHMYIVMLFIPQSKYSTSQWEDQVCQKYLQIRHTEDKDEKGYYQYKNLDEYLQQEYGLLRCGNGKNIIAMSKKPETEQEFYNILTGESYNSMRQDFHISYGELTDCAKFNRAIYDYYEVYMTEEVVAFILNDYEEMKQSERIELTATYVFIVEMITFQNIALSRVINKVSNALSHQGEVDYDYIMQMNEDYARTIKFWQNNAIRYFGTRKEAQQIREAFNNDQLKEVYREQKEFLEHMVDVKSARQENRNSMILNIVLFMISVAQIRDYMVEMLSYVYNKIGGSLLPAESANGTFDTLLLGIGPLVALIIYTIKKKKYYENYEKLREEKKENKYNR